MSDGSAERDAREGWPPPALVFNLRLKGELAKIDAALRAAGIEYIVLKGIPLALRMTGRVDGRGRRIRDNDILVRREDVTRTVAALCRIGYAPSPGLELAAELQINFQYELFSSDPSGSSIVEVHWAPFPPDVYPVNEDYVWSRSELIDVGGWSVRVFDRALAIAHLASHFVQHGASQRWILEDVANAWNAWVERIGVNDVVAAARDTGLLNALEFSLRAANDLGLLTVPPPALTSRRVALLRNWLPTDQLLGPRPDPDWVRSVQMLVLANPAIVPRWVRLRLLPPRDSVATRRGLKDAGARLYLEYGVRVVRGVRRALQRRAR